MPVRWAPSLSLSSYPTWQVYAIKRGKQSAVYIIMVNATTAVQTPTRTRAHVRTDYVTHGCTTHHTSAPKEAAGACIV